MNLLVRVAVGFSVRRRCPPCCGLWGGTQLRLRSHHDDVLGQKHDIIIITLLKQVNTIMAEVDVDHNGKMDLSEFILMMHKQVSSFFIFPLQG